MANTAQLKRLTQGIDAWNKWRKANPEIMIDLRGADLSAAYLRKAYQKAGYFIGGALHRANLRGANLTGVILKETDLGRANLEQANLTDAHLFKANLNGANLLQANLFHTDLTEANLWEANLGRANVNGAKLTESIWSWARVEMTIFGNLDLSELIGLEDVVHYGPSTIGSDTFVRSKGKISEIFLRGCGLRDWEMEVMKLYNPHLSNDERNKVLYKIYDLQASQAIQISPLFISYSHGDGIFVDKLEDQLNKKGIRFWRDVHHAISGRLETQIDHAIRQNPTVLLVLSENSLSSDWVEHEVRTARQLEKVMGRDVLCPVALDDSWKSSRWPQRVMEQIMEYNILDFSKWEDDVKFDNMFRRLIDGLELFYKG